MPYKPKKPCAWPGRPNLTDGKYCPEHQKEGLAIDHTLSTTLPPECRNSSSMLSASAIRLVKAKAKYEKIASEILKLQKKKEEAGAKKDNGCIQEEWQEHEPVDDISRLLTTYVFAF